MKIDLLNTLIKMFFLLNYTSYIYARIMNKNYSKKTCALIFIINFFLSALNLLMKSYFKTNEVMIIIIILSAIIINQISTEKIRPSAILLAFAVCIMSLVISVTAIFPLQNILNRVNNAKIVMMILMVVIQGLTICVLFRIKRFNKGLAFIKEKINNEYIDIITINISIAVIFVYTLFGNYYGNLTRHILISFIILGTIMFVMIQKTLVLYYKQKLLEKTMADYENEIKQKDEKIKVLSEEKFKISKINHEFYNRQKALEMTVNDFINNTNMEVGRELAITNKINSLSKEYSNKMKSIKQVEKLSLTGIEEIDEMFKYMQIECIKNNIDFLLINFKKQKNNEKIKLNNEEPITKVLSDLEYKLELEKKLYEEYTEVLNASGADRIEELADMLEVMISLAKLENKSLEDILKIRQEKKNKRGGFEEKIYLEKVAD